MTRSFLFYSRNLENDCGRKIFQTAGAPGKENSPSLQATDASNRRTKTVARAGPQIFNGMTSGWECARQYPQPAKWNIAAGRGLGGCWCVWGWPSWPFPVGACVGFMQGCVGCLQGCVGCSQGCVGCLQKRADCMRGCLDCVQAVHPGGAQVEVAKVPTLGRPGDRLDRRRACNSRSGPGQNYGRVGVKIMARSWSKL